jgi:hypothetical protein
LYQVEEFSKKAEAPRGAEAFLKNPRLDWAENLVRLKPNTEAK